MKSFYKCSLFEDESFEVRPEFDVTQEELLLKGAFHKNASRFSKLKVVYSCKWTQQKDWDCNRPTVIIPTKDGSDLLRHTLLNLKKHNISKHCNLIVVDDRSEEDIKSIVTDSHLSYLRVDNDKGFNFSMLNNIAAKICEKLGNKTIILWNSDLWCAKEEWFLEILNHHTENKSVVTGTKLLYPTEEISLTKEVDTKNIMLNFPQMSGGQWRNTVQFGGDSWLPFPESPVLLSPIHHKRFSNKEDKRVDCIRGSSFVTGAFQIWDLKKFIELGGLNPTLSKNLQDVDICLRLLETDEQPIYYGKGVYFYHDESPTLDREGKIDKQFESDHIIFGKIWNSKIAKLVL